MTYRHVDKISAGTVGELNSEHSASRSNNIGDMGY
jgi:hypothetical protein